MADEILARLDELKAGQDALQAELLGAVGQSNQAVLGAIQALSTRLDSIESEVRFNRTGNRRSCRPVSGPAPPARRRETTRSIGPLVEEAVRDHLEAEAITDLEASAVGETQMVLARELREAGMGSW